MTRYPYRYVNRDSYLISDTKNLWKKLLIDHTQHLSQEPVCSCNDKIYILGDGRSSVG
jgi:hypothetical protein